MGFEVEYLKRTLIDEKATIMKEIYCYNWTSAVVRKDEGILLFNPVIVKMTDWPRVGICIHSMYNKAYERMHQAT